MKSENGISSTAAALHACFLCRGSICHLRQRVYNDKCALESERVPESLHESFSVTLGVP